MVRKFLYLIVILIALVIAALVALRLWADEVTAIAFVPQAEFVEQDALAANAYQDPAMWFSRPGIGIADPARWQPAFAPGAGATPTPSASPSPGPTASEAPLPAFAVFFVHPTSYLENAQTAQWNAPLDDKVSQARARVFLRGMASPFNQASEIWAPRYRQAAFGAFLTDDPKADAALDAAYADVALAFDYFVESLDADTPVVLAGHSQGTVHLMRLLREKVIGTPLEDRLAMAYTIGWPISIRHDLPALGIPACAAPDQAHCLVGWVSFAEPAEPGIFLTRYEGLPGLDGQPRGNDTILCVNPLTGTTGGTAPASANAGTLKPNEDYTSGELIPGAVPARCDARGLLLIGDPPNIGSSVLPGNNYHAYDIPLFWKNLQLDVGRRMRAWAAAH